MKQGIVFACMRLGVKMTCCSFEIMIIMLLFAFLMRFLSRASQMTERHLHITIQYNNTIPLFNVVNALSYQLLYRHATKNK